MIRTVIIDDEPRNIKLLSNIIRDHCPELKLVGSTDNLTEVLPLIQSEKPDLLIVDIEFPTGTIFPVLEKMSTANIYIIFITAHNTYAAEAFKLNAIDYILKPVTTEAILNALEKVKLRMSAGTPIDIAKLIGSLKAGLSNTRKIPIPSAEGILFVAESDIVRCEASGRYTVLYLTSKKKLTVTRTLKEMEMLLDPTKFLRVHNSHIINLSMIKKYHRGKGGLIELNDGSQVEISSSRKNELLDILMSRS